MSRILLIPKLMFLWLAVGYGIIHAIVGAWGSTIIGSALPASPGEYLQIADDDEPIIVQYWNNSAQSPRRRRLDGTPLTELDAARLNYNNPLSLSRMAGEPTDWETRLDTLVDFRSPATNWYFVAPFDHPGTAYLQGYEQLSMRLIGYIGKNGFTSSRPDGDHRFQIVPSLFGAFSGILTASQKPHVHAQVYEPGSNYSQNQATAFANTAPDTVWLLSQGTLYEIHLGDRTVRTLAENHPDWQSLSRTVVKEGDRSLLQLVVRSEHGIELILPGTENRKTIPLEPASPFVNEQFYQLPDGRQLLTRTRQQRAPYSASLMEILWFDDHGAVTRQETVSLSHQQTSPSAMNAALLASVPCPLVSIGALLVAPMLLPAGFPETLTYSGRLTEFAGTFGPWILLTILIGLITAWATWKRERDVFRSRDWTWPVLVGLGGWFGWMAYICLKPLPARLPNRQWMPAQPESNRPLGTEIFA